MNTKDSRHEYYVRNMERIKAKAAKWKKENKPRVRVLNRNWYLNNKKKANASSAAYAKNNPDKRRETVRKTALKRLRAIPCVSISNSWRARIYWNLKKSLRQPAVERVIQCTIPELKAHLESLFEPWMSWDNWGRKGWHIDHSVAVSEFDLTDEQQLLKCYHWSNMRPLHWLENVKQAGKLRAKHTSLKIAA
jgi:hypothetical protein